MSVGPRPAPAARFAVQASPGLAADGDERRLVPAAEFAHQKSPGRAADGEGAVSSWRALSASTVSRVRLVRFRAASS